MDDSSSPPPKEKLSTAPSWVMVGFAAGVLFVLGYQWESPENTEAPPAVDEAVSEGAPVEEPPAPPANVAAVSGRPSLAVIEAVFAQWGDYALWEDNRTEVALWNSATGEFSDYIEVVRTAGDLYFRLIPRLTRPMTEANPPAESPLRFTEPEALRRARLEGRLERQGPGASGNPLPARNRQDSGARSERPVYLPPLPSSPVDQAP